jgi:uncharacterized protein
MHPDLEVKPSTLPNAGLGLFTKKDIKKGTRIIEYLGEVITEKELDRRAENDIYGYAFYISKRKVIDAYYTPDEIARYANDANGIERVPGIRNNCSYEIWKNRGWITAEKNIPAGAEIFVSYGADYWKDIRYNRRLDKERENEKKRLKKR